MSLVPDPPATTVSHESGRLKCQTPDGAGCSGRQGCNLKDTFTLLTAARIKGLLLLVPTLSFSKEVDINWRKNDFSAGSDSI